MQDSRCGSLWVVGHRATAAVLALASCLGAASAVQAPAEPQPVASAGTLARTPELSPIGPPDREFPIPGVWCWRFAVVPGGDEAIAVVTATRMSAWRALVCFWVEIAAVLLAVAALFLAWRAWHWYRRPRALHCRRCRYLLAGIRGDRCPECGRALIGRGRVQARPWRWRAAAGAALLAIAAGGYLLGHDRLPRQGRASAWFDWYSARLVDAAWVVRGIRRVAGDVPADLYEHASGVARIDLRTGRAWMIHETSPDYPLFGERPWGPLLHPDGATFFVHDYRSVTRHRVSDGAEIARLSPGADELWSLGVDEAGETLFVHGSSLRRQVVWAWDLTTGAHETKLALEDQAWGNWRGGGIPILLPRRGALVHVRCAEGRGAAPGSCEVIVWDTAPETVRSFEIPKLLPQEIWTVSSDGCDLLVYRASPACVEVLDLVSGRLRHQVPLPPGTPKVDGWLPATEETGRFLVVLSYERNSMGRVTLLRHFAGGPWFTFTSGAFEPSIGSAAGRDGKVAIVTSGSTMRVWQLEPERGVAP